MQPLVRRIPNAIIAIINARTFFMAVPFPFLFHLHDRIFLPLLYSIIKMNTKRIVLVNIGISKSFLPYVTTRHA